MHRYGTPSLGTSREELQSSSPSGFPERISVTPIRRNPPCNSFITCRNKELVLRWVFGIGLQEASVAPAENFPSLKVSSFTGLFRNRPAWTSNRGFQAHNTIC